MVQFSTEGAGKLRAVSYRTEFSNQLYHVGGLDFSGRRKERKPAYKDAVYGAFIRMHSVELGGPPP